MLATQAKQDERFGPVTSDKINKQPTSEPLRNEFSKLKDNFNKEMDQGAQL